MKNQQLISWSALVILAVVTSFEVKYVGSSIVTEVKPSLSQKLGQRLGADTGESIGAISNSKVVHRTEMKNEVKKSTKNKPSSDLPSSISRYPDLLSKKDQNESTSRINMEDELASAQYYSKMSKIYSKSPKSTKSTAYPMFTSNYLPLEKRLEDFYISGSMLTMEDRIDDECAGHLLEAEGISKSKMISFKCPAGSAISYLRFEYKELTFNAKRKKDSKDLKHTEIAITGLGFGCDDNQSFIYIGSFAKPHIKLSIPQEKKMWIHKVNAFIERSITGQEYLAGFSASGIDGTFGVNIPNNDFHIAYDFRENPPFVPRSRFSKYKEWSGSFMTGGCVGLRTGKNINYINRIALIPVTIQPFKTLPINPSPESYIFENFSVKANKVLAVPKLWPECQMLFGTSSGKYQSNFFLFKLPNSLNQLNFNFVEVTYTSKHIPISIEFKETVSQGSVLLGKRVTDPSVIKVSRTGSISQITIGVTEENMSRLQLGFVSYLEIVIDGISTIFIQQRVPSFKRTFSGNDLKYICAEVSGTGALLGFGAYFTKKLYVLPFIQGGVQTHFSDLQGIFSSETFDSSTPSVEIEKVQYLLPKHKKRSLIPVVDFISDRTVDVYQGKSITKNVCNFGESSKLNDELDYYLVTCKPGYFLKGLHVFSKTSEDIIQAFQIACGNGEVRIGEKTVKKEGVTILEDVQEAQSLGFEIGYKGESLSSEFAPVSIKIYSSNGDELFHHRTVDKKLKKIITSDSKISWRYSKDGPFNGICFAIETVNKRSIIRGITLAKPEILGEKQISDSIVRPNIFYPAEYRAFGMAYIAFGDVAIATRTGSSAPEECRNEWLINRKKKKLEKPKDVGTFAFTCPKGHIITHIHARSNKKTELMGIVGLLCSDGYSGAIIGTYQDLVQISNVSLVENLLNISPPYYIHSVLVGIPQVIGDRFLAKLETYSQTFSGETNLIYKYLSSKNGIEHKRGTKSSEIKNGPFDTFCTLVQSKLIRNSFKLKKEGILNIGLKPAPKIETLKGGNPIKATGNIFVNQVSYPQCQITRAPLTTEVRETFTVSCPDSSSFTKIIPLKVSSEKNSKIVAFIIECDNGGRTLIGYSSIKVDLETLVDIPEDYKGFSKDLPAQYLTEIDVSFDFKKTGIQGFDLYINDGRSSIYPVGVNKEEISTLYTRRYIGYSLSMICLEFGEISKEVTGFGAYFKSQGLYWQDEFILPPTQFPFIKEEKAPLSKTSKVEESKFVKISNSFIVPEPEAVCKNWAGVHDNKESLSFGLSCGETSIKEITICHREQNSGIAGLKITCDDKHKDSSFTVGVCDDKHLKRTNNLAQVSELEFGFSKNSNSFGFFLLSNSEGLVLNKFKAKAVDSEGLGSSIYWTSDSNNGKILSTLCFDLDETNGRIHAIGVPFESNEKIWGKIEPLSLDEEITRSDRHYASEPKESRTVRGVPKVNSHADLDDVVTLSLNELYGGYITHDKNEFSTYCRKLVGIHKDDSKNTAVLCPSNHRIATIMLYLSSPPPDGKIVGMHVACHSQFKSERVSVDDSWTGMFDVGTKTEYILKQGTAATIFKRLSFGMNSRNILIHVYASDEIGRKYLMYSQSGETISKFTEYNQSEGYNYLRGLCFEMDDKNIHRIGFIIE
ncbi:signal peptide-containing with transmembrane domain [Cryptosporidium sp. chipmunk genotype I]|uniref:signal peptide-containing with transmembrane domain n=1 Tax=Cryptosporidium sp. chipmunk genotype I TaxID=1280935 RepID=UPI00351A4265|nr:signal peptide-containing with transmembrane domain [Cryptosporidium sp. chipmunk genotype I]